jgi:signal transduction histidine kinase
MSPRPITSRSIVRVLVVGFALVILLLVAAAFVGVENARSIQQNAANLVAQQLVTTRLIDEIQREEGSLTAVFNTLAQAPQSINREGVLAQLSESDDHIRKVVHAASPEDPLWQNLEQASTGFSTEARRLLGAQDAHTFSSRELFRQHDEVIAVVARLINASYLKASAAQDEIQRRSKELETKSLLLLGACLVLAVLCAVLTMRMTAGLFRKMEWQTGELSRVSWHMLENQETTARRFSHELHDELGQSLAAVKANLVALSSQPAASRGRIEDCTTLVDEAIRNVRELSQLLRPIILDDFGLDAGLRWLAEGFTQRTGIDVAYNSNFSARLADETETHLFRIAQEALTNIARHSGATRVRIDLEGSGETIRLTIGDNGRGLGAGAAAGGGMGMIGMRARARDAGGEFAIRSNDGCGTLIEVTAPARVPSDNAAVGPASTVHS